MRGRMHGILAVIVLFAGSLSVFGQPWAQPKPKPALTPQVQMEVSIVEVDKSCLDDLTPEKPNPQSPVMVIDTERCNRFITRLQQLEIAKVLAVPVVATQAGQTAYFNVGGEMAIPDPKKPGDPAATQFRPIGLAVRLTPIVVDWSGVRLRIGLEHATVKNEFGVKQAGAQVPALDITNMETTAEANPNQVVVVTCKPKEANGKATLVCIAPKIIPGPYAAAPAPVLPPMPAFAPQVQMEAIIAEVDKACLENLGPEKPNPQGSVMVLDAERCQKFLAARRELKQVRVLCNPTLTTLSGRPAFFNVGGEIAMPVLDKARGVEEVQYHPIGWTVKLTPTVLEGPLFRIRINVEHSTVCDDARVKQAAGQGPVLCMTNMETTADAKPGQMVVVTRIGKDADGKATLACIAPKLIAQSAPAVLAPLADSLLSITPACLTPAAAKPTGVLVGGLKSDAPVAPMPAPALAAVKATAERWLFTAKDDELVVQQEGTGARLVVKEMVLSIAGREVRVAAFAGQVQLRCGRLDANADRVTYESQRTNIVLEGAARVQHLMGCDTSAVTGDRLELDLSGTFAF